MTQMKFFPAPTNWSPSAPNPFSEDGTYDRAWSCFCIDGKDRRVNFCGKGPTGPFTFRLGADCPGLESHLADFLRYEMQHGRQVILSGPESTDLEALVEQALRNTPSGARVRPGDPRWVVHSTTLGAGESILAEGRVKSLASLRGEGRKISGLGRDELGEPPDYADYVVLGRVDQVNAEHVVSSRQKGRIVTDPDFPYQPGGRFYFDHHRIIEAGLAARDGLHLTKVHGELPLFPYLVGSVSIKEFSPRMWTPRTFWEAANEKFFAEKVRETEKGIP